MPQITRLAIMILLLRKQRELNLKNGLQSITQLSHSFTIEDNPMTHYRRPFYRNPPRRRYIGVYLRRQRYINAAWTVAITCALVAFWAWIANSIFAILAAS